MLTKKGNAVGFTAAGETVFGKYNARSKTWRVAVALASTANESLCDPRGRNFGSKSEAEAYAASLVDETKTAELKWW